MNRARRADILLAVTACIWGFAFVAQRAGMSCIGPFLFNAIRFAIGALILMPLARSRPAPARRCRPCIWKSAAPGFAAGGVLFAGASLQQVGLVYTTAGNAGFVTGLYVVLVPLLGLLGGSITPLRTWAAALLSVAGLFLLTSAESGTMAVGDLLVLGGAFFWALHIHVVSRLVASTGALRLAAAQFSVCSVLSLAAAVLTERIEFKGILLAAVPLAYGGLVSVGVAYTLQIVAQKDAQPSHAAVIMSLEAVFAALGGWLILGEGMALPALGGCALMLVAMLLSANQGNPPGLLAEGHGNR